MTTASPPRIRAFTFLGPQPRWTFGSRCCFCCCCFCRPGGSHCLRPPSCPGLRLSANGEGQGEGSFEIIYKHITKFHYFCFADSSTEEYKSSRISPPQRFCWPGLAPQSRVPRAQMHSGVGRISGTERCPGLNQAFGCVVAD